MITISFYSYKGGLGRSLTLTNLGVYLAQFGATVVMVDFDLEAPGLHYKLRPGTSIEVPGRGLAGLLADVSRGKARSEIDWELAVDVSEHARPPDAGLAGLEQGSGRLLLVPAGNPLEPQYWGDLASIDWDRLFTSEQRPGVAALAQLRTSLLEAYSPDVLLVDSRTGITPGGGVATTLLPDVVVAMLLNTPEHVDGSRLVVAAVAQSGTDETPSPRVVPVLSRYTSPPATQAPASVRRRQLLAQAQASDDAVAEQAAAAEVRAALRASLDDGIAERVAQPIVLHTDLALQHDERLTFGPYAGEGATGTGRTLLEDYLRLFAAVVPQDMLLRHLAGVRNRVRGILLDRPDDAIRTLESLATLVGDEEVFVDLMKAYVLRRDARNMLVAAQRLFRIHRRVVVHPALSTAMRELLVERRQRPGLDAISQDVDFFEQYWREAQPDDFAWGAGVARLLADVGASHARQFADGLVQSNPDANSLAHLITTVAAGSPAAEQLAVDLAIAHFDKGAESQEFLRAVTQAHEYHPTPDLARRILAAPAASTIPDASIAGLLIGLGRFDEAARMVLENLAGADPFQEADYISSFSQEWRKLAARDRRLRTELQHRNPEAVDILDAALAEEG
jgi:hypothetical protein